MDDHRVVIETDRLYLRQWTLADAEAAMTIFGDPAVMHYVDKGQPYSRSEVEGAINYGVAHYAEYGFGPWAIVMKLSGVLVGECGLQFLADPGEFEVGYTLAKVYWGLGLATEATRTVVAYGFKVLKLPRLIACAHPNNAPSHHVLEKAGLRFWLQRHDWPDHDRLYKIERAEYDAISRPASG